MVRQPVVAGQFYPGAPEALTRQVRGFMDQETVAGEPALLVMAPHAGYVYSGRVAGIALGQAVLARHVLLLGPNHTGRGARLAVWSTGAWKIPGHTVQVQEELAASLLAADDRLRPDEQAHRYEHSLEVLLPFLLERRPDVAVVPMAVAEDDPGVLAEVGRAVAGVLRDWPEPVTMVVSSDMSHYVPHDVARERDRLALDKIESLDPLGLYQVVRRNKITMCGVLPMTLGLIVCRELGASRARVVAYDTSASASGDRSQVVGYAGVVVTRGA